ncbi:glycosyltransferase [Pedobacter rhodius]|uniref:Glycosyltransferase n=1 Tax=Pedobacter rhodius TaxID=3004098 RepID=A0ABT4KS97_9SPHI|nr:glycosyltransferase [Pedobacter sp. SJ11]MCZ4221796.1 glycosyltransferase [Pedobacter sp. SJ11]
MKILLIMDPGIPVPPLTYGGHERLVYMFAEEFTKLGHQVSLLAGPNSVVTGKVHAFGSNNLKRSKWQKTKELLFVWKFLSVNKKNFDLVHNFGRLAYLIPILNISVGKIMTYGRPVSKNGIRIITSMPYKNLIFTACSDYCVGTGNVAGLWKTVYNAIDFSKYQLQEKVNIDAPLMFLGRLDKVKGVHHAINIAIKSGSTLFIGGNIPDTQDNLEYYEKMLKPFFDGKQIIYLGALNDHEKNKYLGMSKALLFPIDWNEPFGMVMLEAMACGTPVIAFNKGSVKEIISNGENGFIVHNEEEMLNILPKIATINRALCRATVEKKYDIKIVANDYLAIFKDDK